MSTIEAVERAVAPVLSSLGFELLDIETRPGLLRLTIDRESGVDLAAIGNATVAVSGALDAADPMPGGRYELEVSSPGLERRLRRPEHYAKVVGTPIAVKLRSNGGETGGSRRLEGTLVEADADGLVLEAWTTEGGPLERRRIGYGDIERSHTTFDWRAALAADSASRPRESRRARGPTAAERSRAAAAARAQQPGDAKRTHDRTTTETP